MVSRPRGFGEEVLDVQRPVAVRHRVRVLGDDPVAEEVQNWLQDTSAFEPIDCLFCIFF